MDRINPRRDPYRLIGEIFNRRYSIDEFFVSGSFGAVYRATDQKLGRAVAIKILKPDLKIKPAKLKIIFLNASSLTSKKRSMIRQSATGRKLLT